MSAALLLPGVNPIAVQYIYICVCVCVCVCACVCVRVCVYVCTYVYMHLYVHIEKNETLWVSLKNPNLQTWVVKYNQPPSTNGAWYPNHAAGAVLPVNKAQSCAST
jgi:hypothetical protein